MIIRNSSKIFFCRGLKASSNEIGSSMIPLGHTAFPMKLEAVDLGSLMCSLSSSIILSKHSSYMMFAELPLSVNTHWIRVLSIHPHMIKGVSPRYDSMKESSAPNSTLNIPCIKRDSFNVFSCLPFIIRISRCCPWFSSHLCWSASFHFSISFFSPMQVSGKWPWHLWNSQYCVGSLGNLLFTPSLVGVSCFFMFVVYTSELWWRPCSDCLQVTRGRADLGELWCGLKPFLSNWYGLWLYFLLSNRFFFNPTLSIRINWFTFSSNSSVLLNSISWSFLNSGLLRRV